MNNNTLHLLHNLHAISHSSNDAIISVSETGKVLTWNPAAEKIFHYHEVEMLGQPLTLIIPERFRQAHTMAMERVAAGGERRVTGKTVELAGLRKDGSEFPLELSLSSWMQGKERFFAGIIRDITERKNTEMALLESESRFRSISETAKDAIISADKDGKVATWNKAATHLFGYEAVEIKGKPLSIIVPEKFRAMHDQGIRRVAEGGERRVIGHTVELTGLHKDGHEFPIELSLSTWHFGGQPFFCGIIRDISERKKAEMSLLESESRFRSISETANDAIISADNEGRVVSWNRAATNMFGFQEAEAMGQPLSIIVPEKYKALHEQGIRRAAMGGEQRVIGRTVELMGLHKDGHEFPIELSLSTWKFGEKPFFCGIIRDISERKKAEAELVESQGRLKEKAKKLRQAHRDVREKNEQLEALSNKLAKYLSRQVYNSIFNGSRDVKIESYRKKLTVFFSDICNFSELTDRIESEVLTHLLNKYLNEMSKIAIEYGGTIDKYIGDAIMIFFGDPESLGEKEDALACVKMALAMKRKLTHLQKEWEILGMPKPLQIRMGINTGYCTVGNFGSDERLDYTIVGSHVNLASRLENAADINQILISQETFSLVRDHIACQQKSELKMKGFAYPVQTYEVLGTYKEMKKDRERVRKQLSGFSLLIDFEKLNYSDKLAAKEILEEAITQLV